MSIEVVENKKKRNARITLMLVGWGALLNLLLNLIDTYMRDLSINSLALIQEGAAVFSFLAMVGLYGLAIRKKRE